MAVWTVGALSLLEDLEGATQVFERQFEQAVQDGAPVMMMALSIGYADSLNRMGRPAEAIELVQRTAALSDWTMPPWYDLALAVSSIDLGRDEYAGVHVEVVRSFADRVPPEYYAVIALWLCVLDSRRLMAAGEPEQASETMLRAGEITERTGWRHPGIVPWAQTGIEAHFAAGRADRARALIDGLDEISRPLRSRWPRAVTLLGRAQLCAAEDDLEHADRTFEQALAMCEEVPMPIFRAEALTTYGSYLRRTGRPREARDPLARALAICEPNGVERVARLARAELAAAGGRRRRAGTDAAELTAQEERVAQLAARGLTNGQIATALGLAPKTIGHYLERTYTKLGIASRRELDGHLAREPDGHTTHDQDHTV